MEWAMRWSTNKYNCCLQITASSAACCWGYIRRHTTGQKNPHRDSVAAIKVETKPWRGGKMRRMKKAKSDRENHIKLVLNEIVNGSKYGGCVPRCTQLI